MHFNSFLAYIYVRMKLNKTTYFSIFFLFCFLASFSISNYQNLNTRYIKASLTSNKHCSFNSKENNSDSKSEFVFEENENETENSFELPAFILPFFNTCFLHNEIKSIQVSAPPLAEKLTNPIYISLCNFRI